jgi:hypothetical protein
MRIGWLMLCACGGSAPVAGPVANRGGDHSTSASCELPPQIEARRYGNVDRIDPTFQHWTSWRVTLHRRDDGYIVDMTGDGLHLSFTAPGTIDCANRCAELQFESHEPFALTFDLATHTGRITSIDDVWILGPPFPDPRSIDRGRVGAKRRCAQP